MYSKMERIYSFDIFDTLITRTTATPDGIFLLVGKYIERDRPELNKKIGREYSKMRVYAENIARNLFCAAGVEEIKYAQIFEILKTMAPLTNEEIKYLMYLECDLEYKNSLAITENIERVKKLVTKGENVILISDMYFDKSFIRKLLSKHDNVFDAIPIYISSEYGVTKKSINLYREVRNELNVSCSKWVHIGDDKADYENANKLGIETERYQFPPLLKCEKELLNNQKNNVLLQLFVGISRYERLKYSGKVATELGCVYGASILLQYVLWVLNICRYEKITDLFFVARDGWILYKIAHIVKKYGYTNCDFKYLYGSREAWITNDKITATDADNYKKNNAETEIIKKYFMQEIPLNARKIGFVEIHGRGVTQLSVEKILEDISDVKIYSFYYILLKQHKVTKQSFYRFIGRTGDNNNLIELLTRALHGRTVGYVEQDGAIKPVLRDEDYKLLKRYGYEDYITAVLETVDSFIYYIKENNIDIERINFGIQYFEYLSAKEDGEIFEYLCDMPVSDIINGKERIKTYAPVITDDDIKEYIETGILNTSNFAFSSKRMLIEQGKSLIEMIEQARLNKNYIISSEKIGTNIILYGTGKVGKSLFKYIKKTKLANIVAWTDSSIIKNDGTFSTVDKVLEMKYDQIIIAVLNKDVANDIKWELLKKGCDETKIYWENYKTVMDD